MFIRVICVIALMAISFVLGIKAHAAFVNKGMYSGVRIAAERTKVKNGFYNECANKAEPVGEYGKLAICYESERGTRDSFWMILYDSTGQIQFKDRDYSVNENGVLKSYKGFKRAPEWYEVAAKIRKWGWDDFDSGPVSLGGNYYYMVNQSAISNSVF